MYILARRAALYLHLWQNLTPRNGSSQLQVCQVWAESGSDWSKFDKSETFSDQILVYFCSDLNISRFVPFGANLTHFWPTADLPGELYSPADVRDKHRRLLLLEAKRRRDTAIWGYI